MATRYSSGRSSHTATVRSPPRRTDAVDQADHDQAAEDHDRPEQRPAEQVPRASAGDVREPAHGGQRQEELDRAERQSVVDVEDRLVAREVDVERIPEHRQPVAEDREEHGEVDAGDRSDDDRGGAADQHRERQRERIGERPEPSEPDHETDADARRGSRASTSGDRVRCWARTESTRSGSVWITVHTTRCDMKATATTAHAATTTGVRHFGPPRSSQVGEQHHAEHEGEEELHRVRPAQVGGTKRRRSFGTRVDDRLRITPSSVPLSSSIAIATCRSVVTPCLTTRTAASA